MRQSLVGIILLVGAASGYAIAPVAAVEAAGNDAVPGLLSHSLMAQLQDFLRQRNVDVTRLGADEMLRVMVDWYRFAPLGQAEGDALVYRYAGWSEGCATAFKLSLLRQVTERDATGAKTERLAGITLMFDPSGKGELLPFTAVSSDAKSIEAFLQTVEGSPGFKELAGTTPMGVLVEGGGLR
jgi:hypothetical protein